MTVNDRWAGYVHVVVETYYAKKSGKTSTVHVRPIPGQPFPTTMDVECSRSMRKNHPLGTRSRIVAKEIKNGEDGKHFLYTRFDWPYEVVEEK